MMQRCPDTAPGIGEVQAAAWRVLPLLGAMVFRKTIVLMGQTGADALELCPPRIVMGVWIPKKEQTCFMEKTSDSLGV